MSKFLTYKPEAPHRSKNLDYEKVREEHGLRILRWHSMGWKQAQVKIGLAGLGLEARSVLGRT